MALLHAIGFEWGVWEDGITQSNFSFTTSQKRSGNRSVQGTYSSSDFSIWFSLPISQSLSELYLQFAFMFGASLTGDRAILAWRNGTTRLGGIRLNNITRAIDIYTGNFTNKVASGTKALNPNTWYVVEVYVKIHDTDGILTTRIDMIEDATFSGNTKPGAETTVTNLLFGTPQTSGGFSYFDDLIVHSASGNNNNSWPNGAKVVLLLPDSDGSSLEWTPNPSGSHYTTVDEVPPSETDYLQTTVVDKVDELGLQNLPAEALSVKGVLLHAWALKGSTSPPTKLAMGLDLGGTDYFGNDNNLGTSQGLVKEIWEEKPGGGSFSVNDINNAKLLLKSRE